MRSDDLDILIAQADDRYYSDFCRLLLLYFNQNALLSDLYTL